MKSGLSQTEWKLLTDILITPVKNAGGSIWIFGSRARGDFRPFSDIDILVELPSNNSLPSNFLSTTQEKLEESRLPYLVDLVEVRHLANTYQEQVLKERVKL